MDRVIGYGRVWLPLSREGRWLHMMNTYETLSLMIMFGMFVIALLSFNRKK
ncbi:putative holin-like toxin [Thermoanaerobacterium aotearoense]|uniref:putative holin-like toxin n=1 Tax=Thermoanaerobacterium aotearoense TaxID=47490 RepID=UPI0032C484EB